MKEKNLQEIYLDKVNKKMGHYNGNRIDYKMRVMAKQLHDKFDKTWVKGEKGEATYEEWAKDLDNWLNAELLA